MDRKMFFGRHAGVRTQEQSEPGLIGFENFREVVIYLFYIAGYIQEWAGLGRN